MHTEISGKASATQIVAYAPLHCGMDGVLGCTMDALRTTPAREILHFADRTRVWPSDAHARASAPRTLSRYQRGSHILGFLLNGLEGRTVLVQNLHGERMVARKRHASLRLISEGDLSKSCKAGPCCSPSPRRDVAARHREIDSIRENACL